MIRTLAALALALAVPAVAHAQTALRIGQTASGRLDTTDPVKGDGTHYDEYTYHASADQTVTVTMQSTEFDAYLYGSTGAGRGSAFEPTMADDDGYPNEGEADGLDARLIVELRAGQTLVIHASSLTEATGAYTLRLDEGELEIEAGEGGEESYVPGPITLPDTRATALALGQTLDGVLGGGGPAYVADTTIAYRLYRLNAPAGDTVTVDVRSDFDGMLQLGTIEGTTFTPVDYNDDTDGLNPQIVHRVENATPLYALVTGFMGQTGDFRIEARAGDHTYVVPDPNGPLVVDLRRVQGLAVGAEMAGSLDAEDTQGNLVYDVYRLRASADGPVTLHVATPGEDGFDAYLAAGTLDGATFTSEFTDDDSGPGLEPVLVVPMRAGQEMVVVVRSFTGTSTGAYTLHALAGDRSADYPDDPEEIYGMPLDFTSAVDLTVGSATEGRVTATSPQEESEEGEGSRYALYRLRVARTGSYTVTLRSAGINQAVEVGRNVGGLFVVEAQDDDSGVGLDAALVVELDADSTYFVRVARSFYGDSDDTGAFTLQVRQGDLSAQVMESLLPDEIDLRRAQTVRVGQTVTGELANGDPIDQPWDSETDVYLISLEAGESIVIEVTKLGDVDPYVEIGTLQGAVFTQVATDDDSAGDLNSRLEFTAAETGRYAIRISAINETTGGYTLHVRR